MMYNGKPILLVEDDSVDRMAVRRALRDAHITNELVFADNGEDALAYLKDSGKELPCVILLDLNMPKMNGFEFMEIVKADGALNGIPIVVVTTSSEQHDAIRSFELGAAAYITKSSDYEEFRRSMRAIEPYTAPAQPTEKPELAVR